jgi:cytolysin-activating lysine-acyltransferase
MTGPVDSTGKHLPPEEMPSADKLRIYGDLMFLAFRSKRHAKMNVATMRRYFEPAVELGQFRVFRFDDVPRAMFTWAFLDSEAERKLVEGQPLDPADWNSGQRLWIVDMIAPYRGLMASIGRWIMEPGHFTPDEFLFRRVSGLNDTRRVVHVDFHAERLARVLTGEQFLSEVA